MVVFIFAFQFVPERAFCQSVDMALVLVIDTSGSIDPDEYQLQFAGYAEAFRDPGVIKEMTSGPSKAIAVDVLVFSDSVTRLVGWEIIHNKASANRVADMLENAPRIQIGGTYIAQALQAAVMELADCPFIAASSTIDLSGDGPDNEGIQIDLPTPFELLAIIVGKQTNQWNPQHSRNAYKVRELRDLVRNKGININCVAIQDPAMKGYFEKNVMSGKSSFTLFASSFRAFTTVIKKKILREVRTAIQISVAKDAGEAKPDLSPEASARSAHEGDTSESPGSSNNQDSNAGNAQSADGVLPQGEAIQSSVTPPGTSISNAVPAVLTRRITLVVRDSRTRFPLDEVMVTSTDPGHLTAVEDVRGRPGQMLVTVELKGGQSTGLSISASGHEAKAFSVSEDTPDRCEILLEKLPMKLIW